MAERSVEPRRCRPSPPEGIVALQERSGVPVLGVLPFLTDEQMLGVEDFLDIAPGLRSAARSSEPVRVTAIRLPRLANPSDLDPFVVEPDVELRWATRPEELASADLIVIPGSRATVADLGWLRRSGFADAIERCDAWIVGVCAGYQMLGRSIHDEIESTSGTVDGLGLLDVDTVFERPKIVCQSRASVAGQRIDGYQIRYGKPRGAQDPWFCVDGDAEGAVRADRTVYGTSLHGLFDADGFRSELLSAVAQARGRDYRPVEISYHGALDAHHDRLADWIETHLDASALLDLASTASPPGSEPGWQTSKNWL